MRGCLFALVWLAACGLDGTDVRETDLTRPKQLQALQTYSPAPVPTSASDVRLQYTRFQDSHFEGSFTLPAPDFDAYTRALVPASERDTYVGQKVGRYTGAVRLDRAARRVTLVHTSM